MKKFLSVLLVISIFVLLASTQVLAAPGAESYGNVKKVNDGDITLDAFRDETAWENALVVPINRLSPSSPNQERAIVTGTAYILWSDKGLYIFGEINDPTPTFTPLDIRLDKSLPTWNVDSLEIFVDMGNTGDTPNVQHNKVDNQGLGYIYLPDESVTLIDKAEVTPYMEYAGRIDGNTYYLEVLIHVPGASYKTGGQIGIQFQINDMTSIDVNDGDNRVVILSPNSTDADSWDIDRHNYIVLSDEIATPPIVEAPAIAPEEAAPVPSPAPLSPKTGDMTAIFVIVVLLALAGTPVSKKLLKKTR